MEQFTHVIDLYGYLGLIPFSIIEGPIATLLGGFFVRIGTLDPFLVYSIVVVGDAVGDSFYFMLGSFGQNKLIRRLRKCVHIDEQLFKKTRRHFSEHAYKTIIASKLLQGIGPVGLIAAGGLGMPYRRYIRLCISVSLVQSAVFLAVGILFGHAFVQIESFANAYAASTSIIVILALLIFFLYRMKK